MKQLLKDIATIGAGQGAPQGDENYCNNGIPFVKAGNLQELLDGKDINSIQQVSKEVAQKHKLKLYPKGTILFAKSGMSCMKGFVYVLPQEAHVVSHLACITPNDDVSEYLRFYFNFHRPNRLVKDAAYPSISLSDIGNLEIDMKTEFERTTIIKQLRCIESVISLRQQELCQLDDLIKARFVEMFVNQEFPAISLDSIAEVTGGLTKNSKRKDMPMKYPYLRVANVYYNHLDLSEIFEIGVKDNAEVEKTLLRTDDLLFVEGNGSPEQIGRVALWNGFIEPCLHQNHLIKARLDFSKVNPRYVLFYFMSEDGREQIANRAVSTSGLYTLSVSKVAGLVLPIPPIELQNEFSEFVEQTDKSKVEVQKALNETQLLMYSLMQKYFG